MDTSCSPRKVEPTVHSRDSRQNVAVEVSPPPPPPPSTIALVRWHDIAPLGSVTNMSVHSNVPGANVAMSKTSRLNNFGKISVVIPRYAFGFVARLLTEGMGGSTLDAGSKPLINKSLSAAIKEKDYQTQLIP